MPENQEDVLKMTDVTALIDSLEKTKRAMEVMSKEIKSVCYINDDDFRDIKELHETGAAEELAELVDLLLYYPVYNVRCR